MRKEKERKEKIMYWLYEFERLATSRFIGLTGYSHIIVLELLSSLEKEGKIKKEVETNSTYWSLKK